MTHKERIKVGHVPTTTLSLYHLLLNQLVSLREDGYEVFGISSPGAEAAEVTAAGVRHIAVPMTRRITPIADLISLWRLYRVIRRERFSIIHTHNPKSGLLGQLAARMAGVPIRAHTLHGFYWHDLMPPLQRRFYILLERILSWCTTIIFSQNREDISTALAERICTPDKIRYLGNGIDIDRFDPDRFSEEDRRRKRRTIGLSVEGPVIGFVGRLVAEKGILELLAATRIVLNRIPDAQLLLVGLIDHEKADALRPAIARRYGVFDQCVFAGQREDMPELYHVMDCVVLPSHREGFPRVPMEASAMGKPCIVTDVRGCREAVEHGRNGLVVPLGDVPALADAILSVLTQPELADALGKRGKLMAQERFDEQDVFRTIKAEYEMLLQDKGLVQPSP